MITNEQITTAMLAVAVEMAADRDSSAHELVTDMIDDTMTNDQYLTGIARLPVSLASAFSDLARHLGVTLPSAIAAALDQQASTYQI